MLLDYLTVAEGLTEKVNKIYGLSPLPKINVGALPPFLLSKLGMPTPTICWPEQLMNGRATSLPTPSAQGQDRCLRSQRKSKGQHIKVHILCSPSCCAKEKSRFQWSFFLSYCETLVSCDFSFNQFLI